MVLGSCEICKLNKADYNIMPGIKMDIGGTLTAEPISL
jgi:hypothetical protein